MITLHQGDDFASPDARRTGAYIDMGKAVNGGHAASDVDAAHHLEPVAGRRRVAGINRVAAPARWIANAAAHAARIVIAEANAGKAIVGLGIPDGQRKGIIDVVLPRGRFNHFACTLHRAAGTGKDCIHCRGW